MGIDNQQRATKIYDGHAHLIIGSGAKNKREGMSKKLHDQGVDISVTNVNPEGFGFSEPLTQVLDTAHMKAMAVLLILRRIEMGTFKEESLNFEVINRDKLPAEIEDDHEVVISTMDVETVVATSKEALETRQADPHHEDPADNDVSLLSKGKAISVTKLARFLFPGITEYEKRAILQADYEVMEPVYTQPFVTEFSVGKNVSSSKGQYANEAGVEIVVEFNGFSQEIVDAAYDDPEVWNIGPRVNLAKMVLPEHVKSVTIKDIGDDDSQAVVLTPDKYHLVTAAVYEGVLPEEMEEELYKEHEVKTWQRAYRVRYNQ